MREGRLARKKIGTSWVRTVRVPYEYQYPRSTRNTFCKLEYPCFRDNIELNMKVVKTKKKYMYIFVNKQHNQQQTIIIDNIELNMKVVKTKKKYMYIFVNKQHNQQQTIIIDNIELNMKVVKTKNYVYI